MKRIDCALAVLGSGFGGTLLAVIARTLGLSVALLERGAHPRFAIGESSTPLADFKLAAIARRFGLDWLLPLAKYGTWQTAYPHLPCGLKRGFSFFRHERAQLFTQGDGNAHALLVAASPDDAHADTHWFRADFDAHLVQRARDAGVTYLDRLEIHTLHHDQGWTLKGSRPDGAVEVRATFLVDATGDGQLLGKTLGLQPLDSAELHVRSRALYSHFTGVARWHDVLQAGQGRGATAEHPFPCDAAALHHIIDGGWMWVLRFDHGITSAGFSLDPDVHPLRANETPEAEWARLTSAYPSLGIQFAAARPVRPFVRTGRLQRRLTRAAGPDWALLPHAAGFLDAWLSPGIAQTLFAVDRLGRIMAHDWDGPRRPDLLSAYGQAVLRELAWVDEITGTCFARFDRFAVMRTVAMLYFIAAIYCEERERTGQAPPEAAFLLADDDRYRTIAADVCRRALTLPEAEADRFAADVARDLASYNLAGLCDPSRRHMYPYVAIH